jgi:hypothetical protein
MTNTGTQKLLDGGIGSPIQNVIMNADPNTVKNKQLLFYFDKIPVDKYKCLLAHLTSLSAEDTKPIQDTDDINTSATNDAQKHMWRIKSARPLLQRILAVLFPPINFNRAFRLLLQLATSMN